MRSPLRSPAQVEGSQGFLPPPEKDLERPSSARLEANIHVDKEVKFILVDKILFLGNVCSLVKI